MSHDKKMRSFKWCVVFSHGGRPAVVLRLHGQMEAGVEACYSPRVGGIESHGYGGSAAAAAADDDS